MPKPFEIAFGPFSGGINNAVDPLYVQKDSAQDASAVDVHRGTLQSFYKPGSATGITVSAADTWMVRDVNGNWYSGEVPQYTIRSGNTMYRTNRTNDSAASYPTKIVNSTSYRLGIPVPSGVTATVTGSSGAAGSFSYAITYYDASTGLESNPLTYGVMNPNTESVQLTIPDSGDSRNLSKRIYRSENGGSLHYYLASINHGTTTYTDTFATPLTTSQILDWGSGGAPSNNALSEDHSVAPDLTMLSSDLHSVIGDAGTAGSGIVFGAVGNRIRWSMLGYPDYWPTSNYLDLPEEPQAMITTGSETLVFTTSSVYSFSGPNDSVISASKLETEFGIQRYAGRTAIETSRGILFWSTMGLAVFSGGKTEHLSLGYLGADFVRDIVAPHAVYINDIYVLFHAAGTVLFDLRGANIRAMPFDTQFQAAFVAGYPESEQTLYVTKKIDPTNIRRWDLFSGVPGFDISTTVSTAYSSSSTPTNGVSIGSTNYIILDSDIKTWVPFATSPMTAFWTWPGAGVGYTQDLAVGPDGCIYAVTSGGYIYKITAAGVATTYATGLGNIKCIAFDGAGTMYIGRVLNADSIPGVAVVNSNGTATTIVGGSYFATSSTNFITKTVEGAGTAARITTPWFMCYSSTDNAIYMSVDYNYTNDSGFWPSNPQTGGVVKLNLQTTPVMLTIVTGCLSGSWTGPSSSATGGTGDVIGSKTSARFGSPRGIIEVGEFLYLADANNNKVYKISKSTGIVSNFVGPASPNAAADYVDGTGTTARFYAPGGLWQDVNGHIYVMEGGQKIRKIAATVTATNGVPSPWDWTTPDNAGGDVTRLKRFRRLRLNATGDATAQVYIDGVSVLIATSSTWLPPGTLGKRAFVKFASSGGLGTVTAASLEGELLDGA